MSDIGYQSKIQNGLNISYAGLVDYIDGLTRATQTSNAEYERIGTVVNGEYRQLNTHILQIDNEYYSFARPKQVTRSGERPTLALKRRGVQYVELRAIDVDPFEPLGVNESELRFLETLLILCLLQSSSQIGAEEHHEIEFNQLSITRNGRDPKMSLRRGAAGRMRHVGRGRCGPAVPRSAESSNRSNERSGSHARRENAR
jgi:glutamate--cysteine ligase